MDSKPVSRVRQILYRALMIAVLPVLFFGLIDPLEGGLALLLALAIYIVTFLIGGTRPKKYLWIPFVTSLGIGAVVLAAAIYLYDRVGEPENFPFGLLAGNIIYALSVMVTIGGAILSAIQAFRRPAAGEN